jgi:hypothetical protein
MSKWRIGHPLQKSGFVAEKTAGTEGVVERGQDGLLL